MNEREPTHLIVREDHPLIGIILVEDGQEVTHYFAGEAVADMLTAQDDIQAALGAIGSASDLDFEEMLDELDRIRHASKPTPPLDLDL